MLNILDGPLISTITFRLLISRVVFPRLFSPGYSCMSYMQQSKDQVTMALS